MGDKSPKATHKQAAQKGVKTASDKAKKTVVPDVAIAAKPLKK